MYFFPLRRVGGTSASLRIACSSSSGRKNATEKPVSTARTPRPMARWVLPTPGGPRISSACFSRSQAPVASASSLEPLHRRLEREIEVRQRLARRQARQPQRRADPPLLAPLQLAAEQLLQQCRRAQVLLDGAGQDRRQGLGRELQPQLHQLVHQHPQVGRCRLGGQRLWPLRLVGIPSSLGCHRATSASAAYRSTGRRSTGSAAISWNLRAIRPSGLGGITSAVPGPS